MEANPPPPFASGEWNRGTRLTGGRGHKNQYGKVAKTKIPEPSGNRSHVVKPVAWLLYCSRTTGSNRSRYCTITQQSKSGKKICAPFEIGFQRFDKDLPRFFIAQMLYCSHVADWEVLLRKPINRRGTTVDWDLIFHFSVKYITIRRYQNTGKEACKR